MPGFGYILLKVLTKPLSLLPLGFHRACGRVLGKFLGSVVKYRRDVVFTNLSRCFPEMKYGELKETADRFYRHLATIFCEAIWFGSADPSKLKKTGIAVMENAEILNSIYDSGRSAVVLLAHTGNWEILGGYKTYALFHPLKCPENDISIVYLRQSSKAWDEFLSHNRCAPLVDKEHYDGMIETFSAIRYIFLHKDERKIYNFITDQSPYSKKDRKEIEFMGQHAWTMDGGAAVARKFGMGVVYLSMKETPEGNYRMTFKPISDNASEMDPLDIMGQYYKYLEEDLREQPWNYLWTHKRWK